MPRIPPLYMGAGRGRSDGAAAALRTVLVDRRELRPATRRPVAGYRIGSDKSASVGLILQLIIRQSDGRVAGSGHSRRFKREVGMTASPQIVLQNSLLRCERAIIEIQLNAFLNRRCALVLVLKSILLILVVKIVLQHIRRLTDA